MLTIELDQEHDGRWIAEIPELFGVMVYGETAEEAKAKVEALALRVLVDHQSVLGNLCSINPSS